MKIIENTLKPIIERWDDPGDYPSNAGSGPLPSHDYVAEVTGHVVIEIDSGQDLMTLGYLLNERDVPEGVLVVEWKAELLRDWQVKLTVAEFESDLL